MYKNKEWLYNKYCNEQLSPKQIGELVGVGAQNIIYRLNKYCIPKRTQLEVIILSHKKADVNLTEKYKEFIIGNILGDGGVYISSSNKSGATAAYAHSNKHLEILNYLTSKMKHIGFEQCGRIRKYIHRINKATYYCYWTRNYKEFLWFRNYMYKDGKKIISRDLEFAPEVCLQWYLGDGSLSFSGHTPYVRICTEGFPIDDVIYAVDKFTKMGLDAVRQPSCNTIRFVKGKSIDFLKYTGGCPEEIKDIYGYKFDLNRKGVIHAGL